MNILFRTDSSSKIGIGHIMRDLVLAKQYPKSKITFATQELEGSVNHKIDETGYNKVILKSNDIEEVEILIKKLSIDMIIIDHYGIDYTYEKQLKVKNPELKIMVLDDTYEKHHCDILLNHNMGASKKKYKNLVPSNCELRCGSKFTLLREEFLIEKKKSKRKRGSLSRNTFLVFIAMGGADHSNINVDILKTIKKVNKLYKEKIRINLVTTTANKNLKSLVKYCKYEKWIKLHVNSNKIAELMAKSNLAIITPSVTINEIYFMKVPFIAIKTASNQKEIYSYLKKKNFDVLNSFDTVKLQKKLIKLLTKADR
ncbi:UDP-2,4-diacetamido-2,4,6-trideoxy-beta-L-altropyranose hydrolase [Arcobacter arenosus]|uniref:UDP-2,4-diacetamido-2,4, 6-trideoxy-beta-L-altropyranose hydrolase n=1 Tax=Arcobacter arenosus TaxID=2576037 RepID=A0A5R8Y172_9BACT|nr:UDP-2,4-diacetamido-2,4,6-trideoxy-beta-L-altropyranose hydrolase [Arcobacter arenosus]TLP38536.1 UDP-2,4-diacetamido-2,4,6-trideoxy-beta-L-altropyranose hydrolase [Arcobacter arenosus]